VHGDIILLDDLNKASDTKNAFEETIKWCKETLPTRLVDQRTGRIVCIAQRLQTYDVCDYFINDLKWNKLILPMEFVKAKADPLDWRKKDGELVTTRIDTKALDNLKIALGDYAYAQLQQDPVDMTAVIFKSELFKYIQKNELPNSFDKIVLSIDSAVYGKSTSDYTAGLLLGKSNNNVYLIDDFLIKKDFDDLAQYVGEYYKKLQYKNVNVIIENKALGPALFSQLKKTIKNVQEYNCGTKSKLERAHGCTYIFREGRLFISSEIGDEFIKQIKEFPNSKHDDAVDALSQGIQYLDQKKQTIYDLMKRSA